MRLLLATHQLDAPGGTELWTMDMARALQRQGHEVTVFTLVDGACAERIRPWAPVYVAQCPPGVFDGALINHKTCLHALRLSPCPKVFTSHGPGHELEWPEPGADAYVAVSPEIIRHWPGYDWRCIPNGVDLDRFQARGTQQDPPRVLSLCKNRLAGSMVAEACKRQGLPFRGVHYQDSPTWNVAGLIVQADLVVGSGRTAREGLACNRPVYVFDVRGQDRGPRADGWVMADNVDCLADANFSTRTADLPVTIEDLEQALRYPPANDGWSRGWVEKNSNVWACAKAYTQLIKDLTDERIQHNRS